ncbi:hypothetical protein SPF06_05440 [Sinomonas sp. JGH33]|uniref:Uncharacterized protein n=1 Tax=Sinomonas terricola TaxID=3110330 RepID=A0ABU5T3F8_9MICC|nr:hypothetical protein [Sinomonas sp. JGH33]MEA5454163.1 hypothetical protein [Sinomonas sp. JGH33]
MTWLAWATFSIAALLAAARLSDAIRGRGRALFAIFALMAIAILLSIQGPYLALDALLGGRNFANLVIRFTLFGLALLLAQRVAAAFGAHRATKILTGPWGLGAFAACSAALMASFVLAGPGPSQVGFAGQNAWWTAAYGTIGRLYPTFTGIVLLPSLAKAAASSGRASLRIAAGLLGAGYAMLAATNVITVLPPEALAVAQLLNYGTILLVFAGLTLVWASSLIVRLKDERPSSLGRKKSTH